VLAIIKARMATEIQESVEANRRWRLIGNPSVMAKSLSPKLNKSFFVNSERRWTLLQPAN